MARISNRFQPGLYPGYISSVLFFLLLYQLALFFFRPLLVLRKGHWSKIQRGAFQRFIVDGRDDSRRWLSKKPAPGLVVSSLVGSTGLADRRSAIYHSLLFSGAEQVASHSQSLCVCCLHVYGGQEQSIRITQHMGLSVLSYTLLKHTSVGIGSTNNGSLHLQQMPTHRIQTCLILYPLLFKAGILPILLQIQQQNLYLWILLFTCAEDSASEPRFLKPET